MRLTFYGVRGSCPCPCEANTRYGGNTACVVLEDEDEGGQCDPIIFDVGTGLRLYSEDWKSDKEFSGTALVTHIHWDHVQGLPFFPPVHVTGSRLDIYGPVQENGPLGEVFGDFMRPPYFPVHFSALEGDIRFFEVMDETFAIGSHKVMVRPVPHVGATVGYRVEGNGKSVAYISDHQAPLTLDTVADGVLELADGVDVLVHDSQYTPEEFKRKFNWGHCTLDYALLVARRAGAKRLVMFHHDPAHDDETMDRLGAEMVEKAEGTGVEVINSYERMVLEV